MILFTEEEIRKHVGLSTETIQVVEDAFTSLAKTKDAAIHYPSTTEGCEIAMWKEIISLKSVPKEKKAWASIH